MKRPYLKWFVSDWRGDPRLRMCSLAARGLWADMLTYMHEGEPYGHLTINGRAPKLDEIANLVGRPDREVEKAFGELVRYQVFSVADGVMYSRRMVRDEEKAQGMTQIKGGPKGTPHTTPMGHPMGHPQATPLGTLMLIVQIPERRNRIRILFLWEHEFRKIGLRQLKR